MEAIFETNPVFLSSLLGRQWYWSGVLGELYGGAVESRHARDLPEVLGWIREGAPLPTTVRDSNFNPHRLLAAHAEQRGLQRDLRAS